MAQPIAKDRVRSASLLRLRSGLGLSSFATSSRLLSAEACGRFKPYTRPCRYASGVLQRSIQRSTERFISVMYGWVNLRA